MEAYGHPANLELDDAAAISGPPDADDASVDLSAATPQNITGSWRGIPNPTSLDWIGLYEVGALDTSYLTFAYTDGNASGSLSLTVPAGTRSGNYELRLFANNGYTRLAMSRIVGVRADARLLATPIAASAGDQLSCSWRQIPNPTSLDWIGLYEAGTIDDTKYLTFVYTTGGASGTVSLTVPAGTEPGVYELRLFSNNGYTRLAVTSIGVVSSVRLLASPLDVRPGDRLRASWFGIPNPTALDWIGLHAFGADDTSYLTFVYTPGGETGNVSLTVPAETEPGVYELRLFSNDGYTRLARSGVVNIGIAHLTATPA